MDEPVNKKTGRNTESPKVKSREETLEDVKKLAQKAQQTAEGKQGNLFNAEDLGAEDIGIDISILSDTADPDLSHRLFYGMYRLMKSNLPKGRANLKLRRYVYDELGLFLNRGKAIKASGIRGSDMRMAYIPSFLQPAFDTVVNWVKEGANPFELYLAFKKMNDDMGYTLGTAPVEPSSFEA